MMPSGWGCKMRLFTVAVMAIGLLTLGCATAPKMTWLRVDGQRSVDNPAVRTQYELDSTACLGERNKASLSGVTVSGGGLAGLAAQIDRSNAADTVARGCMAEKGYLLVPEEQAAAKRAELVAIAEQQRAQAAPAPPPAKVRALVVPPPKQVPHAAPVAMPAARSAPSAATRSPEPVLVSEPEPTMSEADRAMSQRN